MNCCNWEISDALSSQRNSNIVCVGLGDGAANPDLQMRMCNQPWNWKRPHVDPILWNRYQNTFGYLSRVHRDVSRRCSWCHGVVAWESSFGAEDGWKKLDAILQLLGLLSIF